MIFYACARSSNPPLIYQYLGKGRQNRRGQARCQHLERQQHRRCPRRPPISGLHRQHQPRPIADRPNHPQRGACVVRAGKTVEPGIAAAVVDLAMDKQWSGARAWREHMALTQTEVAQRMGITQGAYAQLEAKKTIRKSSREKIANALGIHESQLDF